MCQDSSSPETPLPTTLEQCQAELRRVRQAHQQELEQRKTIENELRRSQQMLQLVMDTLPETIFWKDRESRYLGCNQLFAEHAGFQSPSQLVGLDDYELPWKTEEADWFRECDRRVMDSGQAEFGIVEPLLSADGQQRWLETNKAPLRDAAENVIGILGTYQDITQRREAEIQLQDLNQKLQNQATQLNAALAELKQSQLRLIQNEKMSTLGNLVAGVAHEINNPMGFLSGNLQPAEDYIQDLFAIIDCYQGAMPEPSAEIEQTLEDYELEFIREDLPKMLASMQTGIQRVRDISTSLRTFSRADNTTAVPFDIHEGLESTLVILKHRIKANEHRPAIQVDKQYGDLPQIQCFPGKLNQVFMNLLANAIDAMDEAGKTRSFQDIQERPHQIAIATEMGDDPDHIRIRIADNGPGIPPDVQEKIFEQYFTTKTVGEGTGLGLAICQEIITEDHGGTLTLGTSASAGAEFILTLPVHKAGAITGNP